MPIVAPDSESDGGFAQTISQAGMGQVNQPVIPNPLIAPILTSATWNSGLIYSDGYRFLTVAATASQAGSLVITEFVDTAGLIPRPSPSTTPLVAATQLIVDIADLKPFQTFSIQIINGSGGASTVTNLYILLSAG